MVKPFIEIITNLVWCILDRLFRLFTGYNGVEVSVCGLGWQSGKDRQNLTRFIAAMRLNLWVYKGMKLFHKPANFSERVESLGRRRATQRAVETCWERWSEAMLELLMLCDHRSGNFKLTSPSNSVVGEHAGLVNRRSQVQVLTESTFSEKMRKIIKIVRPSQLSR